MSISGDSFFQHTAADPHTLTGALVSIVRQHLSDPGNTDSPNELLWTEDKKTSTVLVEPYYAWSPENIQQRPAVIVSRGEWSVQKIGIGGIELGAPEQDGYAEDTHHAVLAGSSLLYCLGTTGLEAEILGANVAKCLLCFSNQLRNMLCLSQFYLSGIGQVSKLEECREHFAVPVTVKYELQWNWQVLRQSPVWTRTSFTGPND